MRKKGQLRTSVDIALKKICAKKYQVQSMTEIDQMRELNGINMESWLDKSGK